MRALVLLSTMVFAFALTGCDGETEQVRNFKHCLYYASGKSKEALPPETVKECLRASDHLNKPQG